MDEPRSSPPRDLLPRAEPRKHLTHHYQLDPSLIIYEEILRIHGPERAARFLEYRKLYEHTRETRTPPPYPLTLNLALADACQLRCPHCYRQHNPDHSEKRRLTWDEIRRILDQAAAMAIPALLIGTETEALLHKQALDTLAYAVSKDFLDIFLATNGLLLTPEVIETLFALNITRLTISLDAATAETYAKVRGGDFDLLVANIKRFLAMRAQAGRRLPVLRLTFVSFNLNRHEAEAFAADWREQGADLVDIQALMDIRNINTLPYSDIDEMTCTYPWEMIYVKWDGSYKPCCSEFGKHLDLGSIQDYDLAAYWAGQRLQALRQSFHCGPAPRTCINCMRSLFSDAHYDPIPTVGGGGAP